MEFLNSAVPTWAFLLLVLGVVVMFVVMFGLQLSTRSELAREVDSLRWVKCEPVQASVSYDDFFQLEKRVYELHNQNWRTRLKRWIDAL